MDGGLQRDRLEFSAGLCVVGPLDGETNKGGREVMEEWDVIQARNGFGLNL